MKYFLRLSLIVFSIFLMSAPSQAFTLICNSECPNLQGWEGEELEIQLNSSECPEGITQEIEDAFEVWNSISTAKLKLKVGGANNESVSTIVNRVSGSSPSAHPPVITCDANFQTTFSLSSAEVDAILGVGTANTVGGETLNTGYIVLNTQSGAGGDISTKSEIQRKIVIAHELGHMLGIGHSAETSALMFFNIGVKENLNLHQDDADAYSFLYPSDEPGEGFLGCGQVQSGGGSPPKTPLFWAFLFLPLLLWSQLKQRPQVAVVKA